MAEQSIKFVDPFKVPEHHYEPFPAGVKEVMQLVGSEVDSDTLSVVPKFGVVDLVEQIQKCKAACGVELMRTLLSQGKAKIEDFYDDGSHGVDVSQIPADVHSAKAAADASSQQFAALAKALGIEDGEALTAQQLEKALTGYIEKAVAAQTQAAPSEVKSDE